MTNTINETRDAGEMINRMKAHHEESLMLMKGILTLIDDKHPAAIMAALTHTMGMVGASMYKDKDEFLARALAVIDISFDRERAMAEKEEQGGDNA